MSVPVQTSILFVDIDGTIKPLLGRAWYPHAIAALNRILSETDAQIVISSDWRNKMPLDAIRAHLEKAGLTPGRIIGTTEIRASVPYAVVGSVDRRSEIRAWLRARIPRVTRWAVIDDMDLEGLDAQRVFDLDPRMGLTDAIATEVIRVLRSEERMTMAVDGVRLEGERASLEKNTAIIPGRRWGTK